MQQGDYATARAQLQEVLALQASSRNDTCLIDALESVAEFTISVTREGDGVRLFAAAAAIRDRTGVVVVPGERVDYDRRQRLLRCAMDEKAFGDEWTAGLAMSAEDAVALALGLTREDAS